MAGALYPEPRFRVNGDRALLVEYGEGIDPAVNERVRTMAELLRILRPLGLQDVVPAYRSFCIIYDPGVTGIAELKRQVLQAQQQLANVSLPSPRLIEIPVAYGGEWGPDLAFVAHFTGLPLDQVIRLHSRPLYHIYAIGFAPGFCYLGGLDPALQTPRLKTPRIRVPAGSVGIAESQTGVYPLASPGGWRIIGRTPLTLFNPARTPPIPYSVGDGIRFVPISEDEFQGMSAEGVP